MLSNAATNSVLTKSAFAGQTSHEKLQTMSVYRYDPLDSEASDVRVITLLPDEFESPIVISLATIALADIGAHEALSYAWGKLGDRQDVTIRGKKDYALPITASLVEALRYLRSTTESRSLWTDAVCIDQQNLDERGSQVTLMSQIYSEARRVILWVGPASDDSDLAIDYILKLAMRVSIDWQTTGLYPLTDEAHWADHAVPLPLSDEEYTALFHFYSRSWFQRLWVWQEVHLADTALLLCGSRSLDWKAVRTGVVCLGLKPRPEVVEWPAPEAAFTISAFARTYNYPLSALLHETRESCCSDPRDRVYALLSFLDAEIQSRIIPNYKLSVDAVYQDVVRRHIAIGHADGLNLLSTIDNSEDMPGYPSWVPHWNTTRATTRLHHSKAALATRPCVNLVSAKVIAALGVRIAEISEAMPIIISSNTSQPAVIEEVRRLHKYVLPQCRPDEPHQHLPSFLKTLTADYIAERHHPPYAWRASTEDLKSFQDMIFEGRDHDDALIMRVLRNIREYAPGRSLCTTTDQRLCLAPSRTRPGDVLTVLLGCDSPLVLRSASPGATQYYIMGESFCHGIMDGESLLGPLSHAWQLVIRHDRPFVMDSIAFRKAATGELSAEDPRLGVLQGGWTRQAHENEEFQTLFRKKNGEAWMETWDDPRISPDELRRGDVQLETFKLI
ncbi:hypothetical protein EK21DRAFT_81692 [Setomelanomma holmii]|uniref:Heterokaryon incompatibility domain-containing protein n=1 Tax=Setomelanomma holmii TaxID=210430 RepID=A0A9P4GX25_9PLEO|nr:hypothetical protein EK21DRAFT_81692 [Setomelanomma holmii]